MTERELYIECIPMILEMAATCRRLPAWQYEEWKLETLKVAPDTSEGFLKKVFLIIDSMLQNGTES